MRKLDFDNGYNEADQFLLEIVSSVKDSGEIHFVIYDDSSVLKNTEEGFILTSQDENDGYREVLDKNNLLEELTKIFTYCPQCLQFDNVNEDSDVCDNCERINEEG